MDQAPQPLACPRDVVQPSLPSHVAVGLVKIQFLRNSIKHVSTDRSLSCDQGCVRMSQGRCTFLHLTCKNMRAGRILRMPCHYGLSSALDILIHLSCSESHLETEFDPIRGMSLKKKRRRELWAGCETEVKEEFLRLLIFFR